MLFLNLAELELEFHPDFQLRGGQRITNRIWRLLDEVDDGRLAKLMAAADYLETWKFIERNIFGLK